MREPIATGSHYMKDSQMLRDEIIGAYKSQRGPGRLGVEVKKDVKGVISPNSPYRHCSQCMAWAYKAIAESPGADVYFLIGNNQYSSESGMGTEYFITPLGFVRTDEELVETIRRKGNIGVNNEIHEHNKILEVQIPFLQHAVENKVDDIWIVPILLNPSANVEAIAKDILETLSELERNAIFIVSSNFTRHGPLFHYVPFTDHIQQQITQIDKIAFEKIRQQDAEGLAEVAKDQLMNFDGLEAMELLLRLLPECEVSIAQYYTSGDILSDYKNSVSYAAIVFDQKK